MITVWRFAVALALAWLPCAAFPALPPLIDRDLLFAEPEISEAQLSPDGQFLAFLKPLNGARNLWVKRIDEPFERARPLTTESERPMTEFLWTPDSRHLLFTRDTGGDENFNIYAVSPNNTAAAGARNLTNAKGVRSVIYATPRNNPDILYAGINDRDKDWQDLYSLQISTGQRTLIRKNDLRAAQWIFDLEGNLRIAVRWAENGDKDFLRLDKDSATRIYGCTVFENCHPSQFHPDGKRFYVLSNRGEAVNFTRLVLVDAQTGAEELVETDPENRVDLARAIFSGRSNQLVATVYRDDKGSRWLWRNPVQKSDFDLVRARLPDREIEVAMTADESLWWVHAQADIEPGEAYLFDPRTKQLSLQYRAFESIPRASLASTTPISYLSSDGLRIPAYLTLPKGVATRALPLIVMPHGGPWARDEWGYMRFAQFFANRGAAVLQPNFRGSTGYGKTFLNAGNKEWGDKIQDDITSGVRHLVERGIADPKRVGIFGESFGGYTALAGAAFTPDVYAAAASWVGPLDIPAVVESLTQFSEPARRMFYARIGDPTTPEGRAKLQRQSPLSAVEKIRTPLLIVQGANDPRVKKADSDQIVAALRKRDLSVQYLVAPDEGHVLGLGLGFARRVNNQAIFAALERFFGEHLAVRTQESLKPEVAQRLRELTVNPESVVPAAGKTVPATASD